MMIQIDDKIVSSELLTERFCCDLSHCKGICCVEGNAGAPLEIDEVEVLEHEWEAYRPYMKPEGIEAVERQGFMVLDEDGDLTTPLIGEAECAYSFEENGVTMCAIERAWREGRTLRRTVLRSARRSGTLPERNRTGQMTRLGSPERRLRRKHQAFFVSRIIRPTDRFHIGPSHIETQR